MKTKQIEELIKRGITPVGKFHGWHEKILFSCENGHLFSSKPSNIVYQKGGCPTCFYDRISIERSKENNVIADHGKWLEIDVSTPMYVNSVMSIDKADWEFLKGSEYGKCSIEKSGYVVTRKRGQTIAFVHRLILGVKGSIDHINHNKSDNRRSNIRECTRSQNSMNRVVAKNNMSGVVGVRWHKSNEKWVAQIKIDQKVKHLGSFDLFKDAVAVRKQAEIKYYGEFAYSANNEV